MKIALFGVLLMLVSTSFAQQNVDPVSLVSWKKGVTRITPAKFCVVLSRENSDIQKQVKGENGELFELRFRFRPIERLLRDHWIVQLFEVTHVKDEEIVGADLFDAVTPGAGGDYFPTEGDIRYFYPETKPLVWINRTKLLTEGNAPFLYPIKQPREFFVSEFKVRLQVNSVELDKQDNNKVLSMELTVEFVNQK